tara:strand:- start:151 stop:885 length:735 start_codon:yes stop_codon:yes gene_type:complete
MIGAYLAFTLSQLTGGLFTAIALGIPLTLAFGFLLERFVIRQLYHRDHLQQVLLTFGLILIFNELQQILWGGEPKSVPVPEILQGAVALSDTLSYPIYRLFLSGVCLAMAATMYVVIRYTRIGMQIRASSSNQNMLNALGVNVRLINSLVFACGVALAGVAGILAAPVETVYPGMGEQILIVSFVVVVIGGIGSIRGAFFGALLIGVTDVLGQVFLPSAASIVIYGVMAFVLLIRPSGLFGRSE